MFGDSDIDFQRPFESATWIPWIAHRTDAGQVEVELGDEGELHNSLRDAYDVGEEIARGYVRPDEHESVTEAGAPGYDQIALQKWEDAQGDNEHYGSVNDKLWVYLNGHVGFGDKHYQIFHQLGEQLKIPDHDLNKIVNHALVNVPPGAGNHQVAWGSFHKHYPAIWRTNADRNAVYDTVRKSRDAVKHQEDAVMNPEPHMAGVFEHAEARGTDLEQYFNRRIPWFISPETDRLVIGKPGQFHAEIMSPDGYKDDNDNDLMLFQIPHGSIWNDGKVNISGGDPTRTFARVQDALRERTGLEPFPEPSFSDNWEDAWEPPTINFQQMDTSGPPKARESHSKGIADTLKGLAQRVGFKGLKTPSARIPSDD